VALTWKNVEWLRSLVHVPFVIKGIRTPHDAIRAVEIGADGIVVSNHGGRNLDGEPGTIELLEDVLEAVKGRATVMLDGGVRRASDIATALGLGAAAVGLGSPVVWALASGEENVTAFLKDLVEDLAITFGMMGVSSVSKLTREHVSRKDEFLPDWALPAFMPPR
jgi:isopentenyl diphosphate isomerase/L-lactate dehydrogenase-like FMN-dependent dehydrogenase